MTVFYAERNGGGEMLKLRLKACSGLKMAGGARWLPLGAPGLLGDSDVCRLCRQK